jgi:hypothetical protein
VTELWKAGRFTYSPIGRLVVPRDQGRRTPDPSTRVGATQGALTILNVSVDRLGSARSILTTEAIGQLGRTVTDALTMPTDCSSSARQVAPDRPSETRRSNVYWSNVAPQIQVAIGYLNVRRVGGLPISYTNVFCNSGSINRVSQDAL